MAGADGTRSEDFYTGKLIQPTVDGTTLTFYYPLPMPSLTCRWEGCSFACNTFLQRGKRNVFQLNKLFIHVRDKHGILKLTSVKTCLFCNKDPGLHPTAHVCLKNLKVPYESNLKFYCKFPGCGKALPTSSGLLQHSRWHKVTDSQSVGGRKKQIYTGRLKHPTLKGSKLTIYFPVPVPRWYCPYLGCNSSFLTYGGGDCGDKLQLQKLLRHLINCHKIKTSKPVRICLICNGNTGYHTSSHPCLKNLQLSNKSNFKFHCDFSGCGKGFSTSAGLLQHSRWHKVTDSQNGGGSGKNASTSVIARKNNRTTKKGKVVDTSDANTENNSVSGGEEDDSEPIVTRGSQFSQSESRVTRGNTQAIILPSSEVQPLIGLGPSASATKRLYTGEYRDPIVEGTKMNIYYPLPVTMLKCYRKYCTFTCTTLGWDNKTHREIIEIFLKLQDHFENEHGVKIAAIDTFCLICEQTFVFSDAHECLQNLKFSNQAELKFPCESEGCGQAFPTLVALLHHSKIHYVSGDTNVDFATASKLLPKKGVGEEKSDKKKLSKMGVNPVPQNDTTDESCYEDMELGSDDGGGDDSNDEDYQCESEITSDSTGSVDGSTFYQLEEEDIGSVVTNSKFTLGERSDEQMMSSQLEQTEARGAVQITSKANNACSSQTVQGETGAGPTYKKQIYTGKLRQPTLKGTKLTVYFPAPVPRWYCPYLGCNSSLISYTGGKYGDKWQLRKLCCHLFNCHRIKTSKPVKICLICNGNPGYRPSSHHCLKNIQLFNKSNFKFHCDFSGCGKVFPTSKGLTRHSRCHRGTPEKGKALDKSDTDTENNNVSGCEEDDNEQVLIGESQSSQPESSVTRGNTQAIILPSSEVQPLIGLGPSASATKRLYTGEYRDPIVEGTKMNIYYPLPVPLLKCCRKDCTFTCNTLGCDTNTQREITEIFSKLQDHFENEHGVKIAAIDTFCLICEQTFVFSDAHECLQNLKFSNQAELKFPCESEGCGQAFPTLVALLHHSKIHYVSGDTNVDFATVLKLLPTKGVGEEKTDKKKLSKMDVNPVPQNNAMDESCHEDMELGSDDGGGDDSNDDEDVAAI